MNRERLLRIGIAAAVAVFALLLVLNREFYTASMLAPFMAVAIGSVVLVHLSVRPWRDLLYVIFVALALLFLQCQVLKVALHWSAVISLTGISSFVVLATAASRADGTERETLLCGLFAGALLAFSDWTASITLGWTQAAHPKTLDLFLYKFDCSLGFQPSFLVGQLFAKNGWLHLSCLLFYLALPVPLTLVLGQRLRRDGRAAMSVFYAFLIAGPVGVLLFNLFPAMGPQHVFPNFPSFPLPTADVRRLALDAVGLPGTRNAIPSLHMTWVLLAWWSARNLPRWTRGTAILFVAFTFLATMGTGEHYLIDLIVAFPFALALFATFERGAAPSLRVIAATTGSLATVCWLLALRWADQVFWINRALPWAAVLATIAISLFLVARLGMAVGHRSEGTRVMHSDLAPLTVCAD